jgi:glycosyltransferase involved in cell wall biosynthesis
VRLILRYPPDFLVGGAGVAAAEFLYAHGIKALARAGCVRFFSDTASLAGRYAALAGIAIGVLPASVDYSPLDAAPRGPERKSAATRFLFIGEGRPEKGFHLLPEAIGLALARVPQLEFMIQVTRASPQIVARLKALGPRVDLVHGKVLPPAQYFARILAADAVLLPYQPQNYRFRASHILIESLAAERAVITTGQGSWMESEMRELEPLPGVLMREFTAPALAQAIIRLHEQRPQFMQAAAKAALRVRDKHALARFFETLLGGAALPAGRRLSAALGKT